MTLCDNWRDKNQFDTTKYRGMTLDRLWVKVMIFTMIKRLLIEIEYENIR